MEGVMGIQAQPTISVSQTCFTANGSRLVCASAVARSIGKTARMVRYLATSGVLPGFKRGKLWFFQVDDVSRYLREMEAADHVN
jgi:hypothetical protein